ncbi:Peroxidase 1 [Raphanus sativus]|uniref:Peroxidase n=1 Tax=Raphanus sativus TaxID=3726 RepID=A0A6J0JS46_RAPSA|nr:peroxidase 1-like [Raphanus sativus]XP_056844262.1 peroxidase 1-like [Raphanus sativus]KAJ4887351.1 Peroxidase 1 [Raphanus sativus]
MALKNLLVLVVLLGIVGVSLANPYGNPLRKQNGQRNPKMQGDLDLDYYRSTCPQVETIVRRVTFQYVSRRPTLAAALLRMHFHDCFVRGCDGSILLKSPFKDAERDAVPNLSVRGYEVVDAAKSALDRIKGCRGAVSCADVLALVARDAVAVIGGPWWPVPLGRRDGRISKLSEVNLPSPFSDVKTLKKNFLDKGLNTKDLVVLSGAHTIGVSSCAIINNRIHNFTGRGDFDPAMNPSYVRALKKRCKPTDFKTPVDMDPGSAKKFDSHYFNIVAQKKGLFTSDATLLDDLDTNLYIQAQVLTRGASFNRDFSESMVKLGFVEILTGKQGEVRRKCAFVN